MFIRELADAAKAGANAADAAGDAAKQVIKAEGVLHGVESAHPSLPIRQLTTDPILNDKIPLMSGKLGGSAGEAFKDRWICFPRMPALL